MGSKSNSNRLRSGSKFSLEFSLHICSHIIVMKVSRKKEIRMAPKSSYYLDVYPRYLNIYYTVQNHIAFNQINYEFDGCLCYRSETNISSNSALMIFIVIIISCIIFLRRIFTQLRIKVSTSLSLQTKTAEIQMSTTSF